MTSPAAGHPVRRQVDLVLDENGDPIDPTLVIVQDPPPPPPPPPSPVYIAVEPPVPPPQPARPKIPARTMLGFRIGVGKLVIGQQPVTTMALGVVTEARLLGKLRGLAEYEWLNLSDASTLATSSRKLTGGGHRANIGLRKALVESTFQKALRLYIDGEIGGGAAWTTNTITGDKLVPHGLVGLRFGYGFITDVKDSPSREFECEFLVRTIITPESAGLLFGVGMSWGG
ncbi:MAG: hypothetical protein KBG15_23170 [Kofleriaceae bacterium]|nr:hypothetical protein [Kofleriaceae bacterium]